LVRRLAAAVESDEDELLILAKKVPPIIRERVLERPKAFRMFAKLDDKSLEKLVKNMKFE
jgi:hypothetical protein